MKARRDAFEAGIFDIALIFTGIVTLPFTRDLATRMGADGWKHSLIQALLLFAFRAVARYAWRRACRHWEERCAT